MQFSYIIKNDFSQSATELAEKGQFSPIVGTIRARNSMFTIVVNGN